MRAVTPNLRDLLSLSYALELDKPDKDSPDLTEFW
jgi:hypothetical protein